MYKHPEELLSPYATMLSEFGRKNKFIEDVCRHDMPVWSFYFPLLSGRTGHVDVQVNEKKEVYIVQYWPRDKRGAITKPSQALKIDNPAINLELALTHAVSEIRNSDA